MRLAQDIVKDDINLKKGAWVINCLKGRKLQKLSQLYLFVNMNNCNN